MYKTSNPALKNMDNYCSGEALSDETRVASYKGVAGGYELNHSPSEISLGAIIECIDGPIAINHCLANEFQCTHMGTQKECDFHRVFSEINRSLRDQLCSITMDRFLPPQK